MMTEQRSDVQLAKFWGKVGSIKKREQYGNAELGGDVFLLLCTSDPGLRRKRLTQAMLAG